MDAIATALETLKLQDKKNISATAKLYRVDRSTLSRRYNGVSDPVAVKNQKQQLLNPQQEKDLVKYINKLTDTSIPLTTAMVRNFAGELAGKRPRESWSQRFCKRYKEVLSSGYLNNIDRARKDADVDASY